MTRQVAGKGFGVLKRYRGLYVEFGADTLFYDLIEGGDTVSGLPQNGGGLSLIHI